MTTLLDRSELPVPGIKAVIIGVGLVILQFYQQVFAGLIFHPERGNKYSLICFATLQRADAVQLTGRKSVGQVKTKLQLIGDFIAHRISVEVAYQASLSRC